MAKAAAANPKLHNSMPMSDKMSRLSYDDDVANLIEKQASLNLNNDNMGNENDDFEMLFFDDDISEGSTSTNNATQLGGVSDLTDPFWILNDWKSYEKRALNFAPLDKKSQEAINLMGILRNSKASLGTYDAVMNWHFRANGDVQMHETASRMHYLRRKELFSSLKQRYNRDEGYGIVTELVLPSRKSRVRLVENDTGKVVQGLLTRPENGTKDYIIFDHNPFQEPPEESNVLADLTTGKCHRETWKALIKDPRVEVLCPLIGSCDGTHIGQFSSFEMNRLKIALGILSREAREKEYNWGDLGWIPNIPADKSQGRRAFVNSGHADSTRFQAQLTHDEGLIGVVGDIHPSQDLHFMVSHCLKGIKQLQETGFYWDLRYNGKLYKNIKFVPYVAFFRVDTKEADLFCGKYTNRNKHAAQLCRECYCPTDESDNHLANFRAKTQKQIANLVLRKDEKRLQDMSQQYILNAFYDLQFGCHNDMGIHGACPMELLHQLYLGIFKRVRDTFFELLGKDSQSAKQIDAIAMLYGELHGRQSDREWPNTRFPSGIRAGKINGKKYTGILLCLLSAIKSDEGRKILEKRPKWREFHVRKDWILLLETLLQWEAWLNSPQMQKFDVLRAKQKHRYIMYLIRKVAVRTTGMGLKLVKFHGILHMADAILNFGVPLEYDTSANESHHIPTKKAAQLTQKDLMKVEEQTAERVMEMELLALAQLELDGKWLCDYRLGHACEEDTDTLPHKTRTFLGGSIYHTKRNGQTGQISMHVVRSVGAKKHFPMVEVDLLEFVDGLQKIVNFYIPELALNSCYTRNGHIFRGDLSYRKSVWRDWVVINWGKDGKLPNRIYGFVDLTRLPDHLEPAKRIKYGGLNNVKPAIYAIVEATVEGCEGVEASDLFDVLSTEVGAFEDGAVTKLKFYLADVETFEEPCVVVPNVGGPANCYFWLEPKARWSELFIQWLHAPHTDDVTEDLTALKRIEDAEAEAADT